MNEDALALRVVSTWNATYPEDLIEPTNVLPHTQEGGRWLVSIFKVHTIGSAQVRNVNGIYSVTVKRA
jgi:hypothetical protein